MSPETLESIPAMPDYGIAEHSTGNIDASVWHTLGISENREEEIAGMANELAMQIAQVSDNHGSTFPEKP